MHGKKGNDLNAGKNLLSPAIMARSFCRIPLIRGAGTAVCRRLQGVRPERPDMDGGGIITDKGTHVLWQVNGVAGETCIKLAKVP